MQLSKQTALDIALAHREVESAEALLREITDEIDRRRAPDVRDVFGRPQHCLQLGVPSGKDSHRLYNVPWPLARVVITAHIAEQRALIEALSEKAKLELQSPAVVSAEAAQ